MCGEKFTPDQGISKYPFNGLNDYMFQDLKKSLGFDIKMFRNEKQNYSFLWHISSERPGLSVSFKGLSQKLLTFVNENYRTLHINYIILFIALYWLYNVSMNRR